MVQVSVPRIGDLLLARGLITQEDLDAALQQQKATGVRLGDLLVASGKITDYDLVDVLSERLGIPKIGIEGLVVDPEIVNTIPMNIARKYRLLALFKVNNRLTVAMADPLDMVAIDEVRYQTGLTVNRVIATAGEIEKAVASYYSVADSVERVIHDSAAVSQRAGVGGAGREEGATTDDAPVVRLVDVLLTEAIKQNSSDLHIEPLGETLRVRFRVDGVLQEEAQPPNHLHLAIISRIKVLAGMDVSEKRVPQDGRFSMAVNDKSVDMRVSTIPTIHGEKIVVRILGRQGHDLTLADLGLTENQRAIISRAIKATEGMLLICGPTSSGKTSTLYAALREITTPEKNVVTVEDPVEKALLSVNQVQVNEKAGLTFPICLRAFLRQNPDVIMVGEIRDAPTAQIAIRAAMTGHLVLSTIHTIDAAAAPHRLIDMGVEHYLVATALRAVIAQRLVRRLCDKCAVPIAPSNSAIEQLGMDTQVDDVSWRQTVGCRECRGTGYAGQIGIFEFMAVDDQIRRMISEGENAGQLRQNLTEKGFADLRTQATALVNNGTTTVEEVLRVIPRREEIWEAIA